MIIKKNSLKVQPWKYCKRSGENHINSWNMCEKRQQLGNMVFDWGSVIIWIKNNIF